MWVIIIIARNLFSLVVNEWWDMVNWCMKDSSKPALTVGAWDGFKFHCRARKWYGFLSEAADCSPNVTDIIFAIWQRFDHWGEEGETYKSPACGHPSLGLWSLGQFVIGFRWSLLFHSILSFLLSHGNGGPFIFFCIAFSSPSKPFIWSSVTIFSGITANGYKNSSGNGF